MQSTHGSTRLIVREDSARLDLFLAAATQFSRRKARSMIGEGLVWHNSRPTRQQSKKVLAGDIVDLLLPETEIPEIPEDPKPISILFEDRDFLAVDKPAGRLSQPIRGDQGRGEEAMDQSVLFFLSFREGRRVYLRMIHRLDRPTSGVMLFARNPATLPKLDRAWRAGKVRRLYLAVLSGIPSWESRDIEAPIARDPRGGWRFHCHPDGKPARSRFQVLSKSRDCALALCELDSGRTHQVRVHAKELGFPIYGDRLYHESPQHQQLHLHAWGISLPHPKTHKVLDLTAPVPRIFAPYLPTDFPDNPWSITPDHA